MAIDKSVVNMHINFYYGNLISLSDKWHGYNVRCAYSKIYYFVSGECEIVIEGTTYRAKAGDMFLIPKVTLHSFYHVNNNYVKKYWFHFEFDCGGENFFDSLDFPYVITSENTKYVTELMEKFCNPMMKILYLQQSDSNRRLWSWLHIILKNPVQKAKPTIKQI